MIKEVTVPEISENVESGQVINVLVQQGQDVAIDQPLIELETEKAAFEVPSTAAGRVVEMLVKEGDTVNVGQTIVKIDDKAKGEAKKEPPREEKQAAPKKEQPVQTVEPQPAVSEQEIKEEREPEQPAYEKPAAPGRAVAAAPSVRQLARELGIDITQVKGTETGGRISLDDVKNHARNIILKGAAGKPVQAPASRYEELPDFSKWGQIERKPATATRKKTAEAMSSAWSQVAHVTQHDAADITLLQEFIAEYSDSVKQSGGKLTVTAILIKAVANALQSFSNVNASYDPQSEEIIYKKYVHISVAVDTDRGLLVPVLRDADKKSIRRISAELTDLAEKARKHKIMPDEMLGGTFTITNLGGIGGTYFTPIVYWPQAAILGISRAVQQPVYADGAFEARWMLPLSLSYDHRIVDGAEGIRFLRAVIELLENPFKLALNENE